jgi:hypothetical protein
LHLNASTFASQNWALNNAAIIHSRFTIIHSQLSIIMQDITVIELKKRLDEGDNSFVFIDVREPYEYEAFNLGAKLIPLGTIAIPKCGICSAVCWIGKPILVEKPEKKTPLFYFINTEELRNTKVFYAKMPKTAQCFLVPQCLKNKIMVFY